jgi:hypothetical protein
MALERFNLSVETVQSETKCTFIELVPEVGARWRLEQDGARSSKPRRRPLLGSLSPSTAFATSTPFWTAV